MSKARLFYAEDNNINQRVLGAILKRFGVSCQMCDNGVELLEALQGQQADLIFMDIQMPEMDGVEATRRIRAGEAGPGNANVPIVGLSAFARMGDASAYAEAGMDGYYDKPIHADTIRRVLTTYQLLPQD
ncbi:MAG: response regulator [Verrucomicrobiota bacterium JB022]|nr:response regulator [Verrucomicrobiota bacterium JB022]